MEKVNEMELNWSNIKRLVNVGLRYLKQNRCKVIVSILAYVYLLCAFCLMALFFSYNIRLAIMPLGYFVVIFWTIIAYFGYVIINHSLVRMAVSHKTLLIFDLLAFIMLVCIAISDIWAGNG